MKYLKNSAMLMTLILTLTVLTACDKIEVRTSILCPKPLVASKSVAIGMCRSYPINLEALKEEDRKACIVDLEFKADSDIGKLQTKLAEESDARLVIQNTDIRMNDTDLDVYRWYRSIEKQQKMLEKCYYE